MPDKKIVRGVCVWKPGPNFDEQVLLIYEKSRWGLPGGHAENGENAKGALEREFEEEAGLAIKILGQFYVHTTTTGTKTIKEYFFIAVPLERRAREIATGTGNVAWFPIRRLPRRTVRHYELQVRKALRLLEEKRQT